MGKKSFLIWCNECHEGKSSEEFYVRLTEIGYKEELVYKDSPNEISYSSTENRSNGICKECFMKKYFKYLDDNNGNIKEAIYKLCEEYDLPYDEKIIQKYIELNKSCSYVLKAYMKDVHDSYTLKDEKFHAEKTHLGENDSEASITIRNNKGNTLFSINKDEIGKEKSDIDFINDDIKRIKVNIQKALDNEDTSQHGKWLNSLRDALELRNKLEGNDKPLQFTIPEHYHTITTNDGQTYTTSKGGGCTICLKDK